MSGTFQNHSRLITSVFTNRNWEYNLFTFTQQGEIHHSTGAKIGDGICDILATINFFTEVLVLPWE